MGETLKFIWSLLRPHKRTVYLSSVLAVAAAVFETVGPILMGRGFDYAGSGKGFAWFGGALLLWFAFRWAADMLRSYVTYRGSLISSLSVKNYMNDMYSKLLEYPLPFHYGSSGRKVRENIDGMRWGILNFIENTVFSFVPALLTIVTVLAYLLYLDLLIGTLLTISVIGFIAYTIKASPEIKRLRWEWNNKINDLSTYGWDACQNILVVKSTNNEDVIRKRMEKLGDTFVTSSLELARFEKLFRNRQNLIIILGSTSIVLVAAMRFSAGAFTFGMLSAVTAYAFTVFGQMSFVQWGFIQLIRIRTSREMIAQSMKVKKENYSEGEEVDLSGDIEFKGVRFRYHEERPILEDVAFSIRAGERVAIVGESGEGKTTLVDLIGRYYEPQKGTIKFGKTDVRDIKLPSLRSQMAYVPQDLTLFHDTIETNIRFGRPNSSDEDLLKAVQLAHLEGFITSLPKGWGTVVGERGMKLSGGERQRVALARAFLRDPKILILDEPTSNLDSKTEAFIQDSLGKLMKGRTTFIIAHRLKTVMSADLILVLKGGHIVETGTHNDLLRKKGAYAKLIEAQSDRLAG